MCPERWISTNGGIERFAMVFLSLFDDISVVTTRLLSFGRKAVEVAGCSLVLWIVLGTWHMEGQACQEWVQVSSTMPFISLEKAPRGSAYKQLDTVCPAIRSYTMAATAHFTFPIVPPSRNHTCLVRRPVVTKIPSTRREFMAAWEAQIHQTSFLGTSLAVVRWESEYLAYRSP